MTPAIWRIIHDWRVSTFPASVEGLRVVEIGARSADGQEHLSIRNIFHGATYTGIDILPGVEICADATDCATWPNYMDADVILCLETLEHVPKFWRVLKGIRLYGRAGTWVVLSAPGLGFPEHKHPYDCYRFTPDGLRTALMECGAIGSFSHTVPDTLGYECHVTGGIIV